MADFNGKIKKVKIKESSSSTNVYLIIVDVDDDYNNDVAYVQVEFDKEKDPRPKTNPVFCKPIESVESTNGKRSFENSDVIFEQTGVKAKNCHFKATMLNAKGEILQPEKVDFVKFDTEDYI